MMSNISVFLTEKKSTGIFTPMLRLDGCNYAVEYLLDDIQSVTHWILGYTEFCIFLN